MNMMESELIFTLLLQKKEILLKSKELKIVEWDACKGLEQGCFSSKEPSKLTAPQKARMARFSASFVFPSNSEGYRQIYSRFNGNDYPLGYLTHSQYGGFKNGSSNSFSAIGPWVDVKENDYWELIVVQNSGANFLIEPKTSNWFQAEWFFGH